MTTKATSCAGVKLSVQKTGTTWTALAEVSAVPEIGQTAEKIDVTHLQSVMKEYVKDIPDFSSDLEFTMNMVPSGETDSNFDLIKSLNPDQAYKWKIEYPQQKVACELTAQFTWRVGASEVSAKQDIILTLIPQSAPVFSTYTPTKSVNYTG